MNTTKHLLLRDLKNCNSTNDVIAFKEVLKLSHDDLSIAEAFEITNEIYDRLVYLYAKEYTEKRYPAHEIWRFFQDAKTVIKCDAILLHILKNITSYTETYIDKRTFDTLAPLSSIDIFINMARKRKETILNEFVKS